MIVTVSSYGAYHDSDGQRLLGSVMFLQAERIDFTKDHDEPVSFNMLLFVKKMDL